MRKELAHCIPNHNMAFYYVKIGFRILTTIFTKTAMDYKAKNSKTGITGFFIVLFSSNSFSEIIKLCI